MTLRIATRGSALALAQANDVAQKLRNAHAHLTAPEAIELVIIKTEGDKNTSESLSNIGGKGLFIKEIERSLLLKEADIAVHSMKDMPAILPSPFSIACVLEREDARDVWISPQHPNIETIPANLLVGTASPRRESIMRAHHKNINIKLLRGNVPTRIKKCDDGEYDGIILAAAGLHRLGLKQHIAQYIPTEWMLPAAAQGAVGIEILAERTDEFAALLKPLNHTPTQQTTDIERNLLAGLGADCTTPIAAYAQPTPDGFHLRAELYHSNGDCAASCSQNIKIAQEAFEIGNSFRNSAPAEIPLLPNKA